MCFEFLFFYRTLECYYDIDITQLPICKYFKIWIIQLINKLKYYFHILSICVYFDYSRF